jgi:hypothetical protein
MTIGIERDYGSKEMELLNWFNNYGAGLSGITNPEDLPKDCLEFCMSQFQRFGIPVPPEDIIFKGMWATFCTLDYFDPYSLFYGDSDVEFTDEWRERAYKVDGEELDPEFLETYRLIPGQDEVRFNAAMANPGLHHINCSDMIEDGIDGEFSHDHVQVSEASNKWLEANTPALPIVPPLPERMKSRDWIGIYRNSQKAGFYDLKDPEEKALIDELNEVLADPVCAEFIAIANRYTAIMETRRDFFRLAAWATYVWIMGPLGRNFRRVHYDIFNICYDHGECVLYSGSFFSPKNYTCENRSPRSCEICGLDSYCVELSYINGSTKFICEKHLNGELPKFTPTSCGSRSCKFSECKHHPMHGVKDARVLAYRDNGQLTKKVKEQQLLLPTNEAPRLLN